MNAVTEFPIVLKPLGGTHPCAACNVRQISICDAIPETDLARLGACASAASPGPARCSSPIRPRRRVLQCYKWNGPVYKLLPDGRRQITGFADGGSFLGLAVSDTYAFSAEAIDTVRYCTFPHIRLRALMHDFPHLEARLLKFASADSSPHRNKCCYWAAKARMSGWHPS